MLAGFLSLLLETVQHMNSIRKLGEINQQPQNHPSGLSVVCGKQLQLVNVFIAEATTGVMVKSIEHIQPFLVLKNRATLDQTQVSQINRCLSDQLCALSSRYTTTPNLSHKGVEG